MENGGFSSRALIKSDLSLTELSTHYQSQIHQAGWVNGDLGQTDSLSWSSWSFVSESVDWRGIFSSFKSWMILHITC
jgi:hypothetical protein